MKMKTTGLRQALLTAICGAGVGLTTTVTAAGLYELDGNALNNPGDTLFEADQIYCDHNPSAAYCSSLEKLGVPGSQTEYSGALVSGFIFDKYDDPEDDIFQKSVKDSTNPSDKWSWQINSSNDKNDISHTWVAISKDSSSGHYFLHFGISVISENGDAAFGIWFNQNNITPTTVDGNRVFAEGHENGDILVQGDVINGGTIGRFDVYTWGTIDDPNNNLLNQPVASSQGELTAQIRSTDCSNNPDPRACAVVNANPENSPWEYQAKSGPANVFPPVAYFEGKLDLTSLFPGELPCVGSVVAETRQSQSETASLEDFAARPFDLCSIEVRKTGPLLSKVGDKPSYTIEIENTGIVDMTKESVTDTLQADLSSTDPDCGTTLNPGDVCTITYQREVLAGDPDPLLNTVTAIYSGQGDTDTQTASHSINLFQPSVSLDKKANGSDGTIKILQGDPVNYSIVVENTSSSDTPALSCTITDSKLTIGSDTDADGNPYTVQATLLPGEKVTLNKSKADSTDDLDKPNMNPGYTNTADVLCTLADFPNQVTDDDSVTVKVRPRDVTISVTKTGDGFAKGGDALNYLITIKNVSDPTDGSAVSLDSITDTLKGDLTAAGNCPDPSLDETLAIGASCTISYSLTTAAGDTSKDNTVTVKATDSFGNADTKTAMHKAVLINPAIDVTESCTTPEVEVGDTVTFKTYVENNGDIQLTVALENSITGTSQVVMGPRNGDCQNIEFDSDPSDGCLLIETSTTATSAGTISSSTSAVGSMPEYTGLTNMVMDNGSADCTAVEPPGGATRTLGFWKTHGSDGDRASGDYGYTCHIFENHLGGSMHLGWKDAQTCADVFNLFWANPAKEDDGSRRDRTCQQTRYIQASWQLMAAILNTGLHNGAEPPLVDGESAITLMQEALANGDRKAITSLLGVLGEYNESGDDEPIVDNDGTAITPADPNGTREEGDNNAFGFNSCP